LAESLIRAHHDMHTRFPVTERADDPQGIVGYVNLKDIVAALRLSPHNPSLRSILRMLPGFRSGASVASCLESLIRDHNHIALVRDAENQIVGMVTMEDILEELVGEIHDEYDRLPAHIVSAGSGWVVGGNAGLERLRQVTGLDLKPPHERPVQTLNEWVIERLGRPVDKAKRSESTTSASWSARCDASSCSKPS
jgi:putative hemolysin